MAANQAPPDPRMAAIIDFLLQRNPALESVGWTDDLIDSRILDSLAFAEFFVLLEELYGQEIDLEYFDVESLRSLDRIKSTFFDDQRRSADTP